MEELIDILVLFSYMSPPKGRATAVVGIGGGNSVRAADACASAGLTMPLLPEATRDRLKEIYTSEVGGSFRNPVDTYFVQWGLLEETIKVVADCDQIDLLILHITLGFAGHRYETKINLVKPYIESIISTTGAINKPVAIVLYPIGLTKYELSTSEAEAALCQAGLSVFPSVAQAAKAIVKYIDYHQR